MRYRGVHNIPYAAAGDVLLPAFFLYGTAGQDCHRSTGFVLTDAEDPETNGLSGTGNQSDVLGGAVCDCLLYTSVLGVLFGLAALAVMPLLLRISWLPEAVRTWVGA